MARFMLHGCTPDITLETSENVAEESMTRYGRKKEEAVLGNVAGKR
jgi:hypothetical protein